MMGPEVATIGEVDSGCGHASVAWAGAADDVDVDEDSYC